MYKIVVDFSGLVAQIIEQPVSTGKVGGEIPSGATNLITPL